MHDRTNNPSENSSNTFEQRKHDHLQWVNRYLDLADTALEQKKDDQDRAA
jgi:hypothetical protein